MKVGIIGDLHAPFTHPRYLEFTQDIFSDWGGMDAHVFIGDGMDGHAWSYHETDPDGYSAKDEFDYGRKCMAKWYKAYPKAKFCLGNHDLLFSRKAKTAGLPEACLRPYKEIYGTPGWQYKMSYNIEGVHYCHGMGVSGKNAALNLAFSKRMSVVMGHIHSWGGVQYHANENNMIFGMNVGCGIDVRSYAQAYGRDFKDRPTLGCGIVIDGRVAVFEPMPCGRKERYARDSRERAGKLRGYRHSHPRGERE